MLIAILRSAREVKVAQVAMRAQIVAVIQAAVRVRATVMVIRQCLGPHMVSRNQWHYRYEIYPQDQMVRIGCEIPSRTLIRFKLVLSKKNNKKRVVCCVDFRKITC